MRTIVGEGAEAVILRKGNVLEKVRQEKKYRLREIDIPLRKFRTRREAKVLETLGKVQFPAPRLLGMDDTKMVVTMEEVSGEKIRDILELRDYRMISAAIGERLAELHNLGVIHGDLTTSNMILTKDGDIAFIDFGLSFFSRKIEDRAVDLHLLRTALESKHYKVWEDCFNGILNRYKGTADQADAVVARLEEVEARGRNKAKF